MLSKDNSTSKWFTGLLAAGTVVGGLQYLMYKYETPKEEDEYTEKSNAKQEPTEQVKDDTMELAPGLKLSKDAYLALNNEDKFLLHATLIAKMAQIEQNSPVLSDRCLLQILTQNCMDAGPEYQEIIEATNKKKRTMKDLAQLKEYFTLRSERVDKIKDSLNKSLAKILKQCGIHHDKYFTSLSYYTETHQDPGFATNFEYKTKYVLLYKDYQKKFESKEKISKEKLCELLNFEIEEFKRVKQEVDEHNSKSESPIIIDDNTIYLWRLNDIVFEKYGYEEHEIFLNMEHHAKDPEVGELLQKHKSIYSKI